MAVGVKVELSKRSQELIAEYLSLGPLNSLTHFQSPIDSLQLISWLHEEVTSPLHSDLRSKQQTEFILASLQAELLRDLLASMKDDNSPYKKIEENISWTIKLKFALLALAGTLFAGCEGFDGVTTMLGILSLSSLIILVAGLAFSILSIVVFYSYELVQISKTLGVSIVDAPKLLDIYLLQLNEIKGIRRTIETYKLAERSTEELVQLEGTIVMLQKRFKALVDVSTQFEKALNSNKMQAAKIIVSSMVGLLFFGSGFFAGQSVALFISALFIPVVLPTFWPVILFSAIVGFAALSLYWYVEQPEVKKLVSGWFGLDEDNIDKLCNKNKLDVEEKKLENLKNKVTSTAKLTNRLIKLQQELNGVDEGVSEQIEIQTAKEQQPLTLKTSTNIYSFHPKPVTPRDPHLDTPDFENVLVCQSN